MSFARFRVGATGAAIVASAAVVTMVLVVCSSVLHLGFSPFRLVPSISVIGDAGGSWGAIWEAAAKSPREYQQATLDTMLRTLTQLAAISLGIAALSLTLHTVSRLLAAWRSLAIRYALGATMRHLAWLVGRELLGLIGAGTLIGLALGAGVVIALDRTWPALFTHPALVVPALLAALLALILSILMAAAILGLLLLFLQRGIRLVGELQGSQVTSGAGLMLLQRALAVLQVGGLLVVTYGCALVLADASLAANAWVDDSLRVAPVTFDARAGVARRSADLAQLSGLAARATDRMAAVTSPDAALGLGKQVSVFAFCLGCHIGNLPQLVSSTQARVNAVSPSALRVMSARMMEGRDFSAADSSGAKPVAILSVAAASALFPGASPLGRTLVLASTPGAEYAVVGVTRFVAPPIFGSNVNDPLIFVPIAQHPPGTADLLAGSAAWDSLRSAIAGVKADAMHVGAPRELNARVRDYVAPIQWFSVLFAGLAATATAIAAWSLVAVMTQVVELREREIGIRLALGADRRMIANWVAERTVWTTVIGLTIGVAGGRWIGVVLHGELSRENDLVRLGSMTILILALGLLASLRPAWRAARLEPMVIWASVPRARRP